MIISYRPNLKDNVDWSIVPFMNIIYTLFEVLKFGFPLKDLFFSGFRCQMLSSTRELTAGETKHFIIILTVMWTNSSIYETSDFKLEAVSEWHVEHPNIADHTWPKLFLLSF